MSLSLGASATLQEVVSPKMAKDLLNMEIPKQCFKRKNIWTDTQCFWRAQVWSYAMEQNYNVKAEKAFMFYSKKYRNKEHCGGGSKFHVTPVVKVMGDNGVVDYRTLDGITHSVLNLHTWSRIWIKDRNDCHIPGSYQCPIIKWEDYKGYQDTEIQNSEWCYIVVVPRYMYYERDLETKRGQAGWEVSNLKQAFGKIKSKCLKKGSYAQYKELKDLVNGL